MTPAPDALMPLALLVTSIARISSNAQMNLAPFAPVFGSMPLAFSLAFAQKLDACAVHQQVKRGVPRLVVQLDLQILLASADGAEIWDWPVQSGQLQKTLDHAERLSKGLAEQALDAQAQLDCGIRERLVATRLPLGSAIHCIPRSSHIVNDPRAFSGSASSCLHSSGQTNSQALRFVQQSPRALEAEVNAEIAAIWAWLQRQKLRPGQFGWEATRRTSTSKDETLTVVHGTVVVDGGTILHPQETRVVGTLPEKVAVQFRFEFNVVDDRR